MLERVQLRNLRCHAHCDVRFQPGLNALVGTNGAGKSTIVAAIGWALFGAPPTRPLDAFLRHGTAKGHVAVNFRSALDGQPYQAVRVLHRHRAGEWFVRDARDEHVATGTQGCLAWLPLHLGVRSLYLPLPELWQQIVGVPQGTLVAAFHLQESVRAALFDSLLGLGEFDELEKRLGRELTDRRKSLATLEAEQQAHARLVVRESLLREQEVALEAERAEAGQELARLTRSEADATAGSFAWGEAAPCPTWAEKLGAYQVAYQTFTPWASGWSERMARRESALTRLQRVAEAHQAAISRLADLHAESAPWMQDSYEAWERELTAAQVALGTARSRLGQQGALAEEGTCPTCERPLTVEALAEAIATIQQEVHANESRVATLEAARDEWEARRVMAARVAQTKQEVERLEGELAAAQRDAIAEEASLTAAGTTWAEVEAARLGYETYRQAQAWLRDERVRAEGQLSEVERRAHHLTDELARVCRDERAYLASAHRLARGRRIERNVQYLRGVLKRAAPLVRCSLIEQVAAHATYLYHEMTGQEGRILWDETYAAGIEDETGAVRWIGQHLSGGEQMIVALSLRLALLEEAGLRFTVLDEPTAHLDTERRYALASQLGTLPSTQMLVVAHDDTFAGVAETIYL